MKVIKVALPETEIAELDEVAKLSNSSRAEVIRDRIRSSASDSSSGITLERYQKLVTRVIHVSGLSLPRPQVESLVATVVAELSR